MSTEKNVMNANEESIMNCDQLNSIKARLLTMKKQLLSKNPEIMEPERPSDPLDQAQQEMHNMMQLQRRALDSDLLSEVEKALYRIQSGVYGYCEISGEPIDIRRLQANPVSRTSVEEQEQLERGLL